MDENPITPINQEVVTPVLAPADDFDFQGKFLGSKELLTMAWGLYKQRFWALLLVFLIPSVLAAGIGMITAGMVEAMIGGSVNMMVIVGMAALWAVIGLVVVPLQTAAIMYMIDGIKAKVGIKEAFVKARGKILPYWQLMILEGLIVAGAFLPLIIPGLILSVWFMFSIYVVVFENLGGLKAMMRSREYVKGRWWAVLGRQMYGSLIYLGIIIILSTVTAILSGGNKETAKSLENLVNLILLPLTPLFMVYAYLIYKNLKAITPIAEEKPGNKILWYLLAVWGIIGPVVIMGALMFTLFNQFKKASDAAKQFGLRTLKTKLEMYSATKYGYPKTLDELSPGEISAEALKKYTNDGYTYTPTNGGKNFEICVTLSTKKKQCLMGIELVKSNDTFMMDAYKKMDLRRVQVALEFYATDSTDGLFPAELTALIPKYLVAVGSKTTPEDKFTYKPAEDLKSYELCIEMPDGKPECATPIVGTGTSKL